MKLKELLDNRYVISCLIVGLFDTIIIVVLGALFGKDIATLACTILIGIAIPLFGKVKKLSISRRIIDEKEVSVNILKTNYYNVVLVVFSYFGIITFFIILYFIAAHLAGVNFNANSMEGLMSNTFFAVSMIVITLISFFLTGFLYAKISTNSSYLGATVAAVVIIILNTVTSLVIFFYSAVDANDNRTPFAQVLPFFIFWSVYIALMLFGAYLGFRKRRFIPVG